MSERANVANVANLAYLSTRKGLFELRRQGAQWQVGARHFLGEPVSIALADARDGALYAALNLGHFGVKLHRRDAHADSWTEIAAPAYPLKPEDSIDPVEWKNKLIWSYLLIWHKAMRGIR